MEKIAVSIVVPCYNEAHRLEPTLSESLHIINNHITVPFEVIIVDDGSTDGTLAALQEAKKKNDTITMEIMHYPQNKGKGYAVKTGMLQARGEKILTTDSDFSIDLSEIDIFLQKLDEYDVVIGSKKHLMTQTMRHQKPPRRFLGKGFTILTNLVLGLSYTDITCGFKSFRNPAAKKLFGQQRIYRWAYDSEILFLAKKYNYTVLELPVKWYHILGTKVSPIRDTWRSAREIAAIILNNLYGKYNL